MGDSKIIRESSYEMMKIIFIIKIVVDYLFKHKFSKLNLKSFKFK